MWPILGPLQSYQTHRSINFNHMQRSFFSSKPSIVSNSYPIYSNNQLPPASVSIKSNIRYIDPSSSTCLLIYTFILLLFCVLPIFALNIYFRQAFASFSRRNSMQVDQ